MLSLSPSTVSRALSDHPDISEATKQRVNEVADAFNYTVNLHSNFFRNRKSNLVALIIPEINMFFTPQLIRSVQKELSRKGYSLFVLISNDSFSKESEMLEQCIKWAVEGVLISVSGETKNANHIMRLKDFGIKTIMVDRVISNTDFPTISSDSFGSAYSATEHLINNGHRNILGLFGNPNLSITKQRIAGFDRAIANYQGTIQVKKFNNILKAKKVDEILPEVVNKNKDSVTAIFTMSDELLSWTHYTLSRMGIKVYDEISLITISDGVYPYIVFPNVSYVKDSGSKMGKRITRKLIDLIEGREVKHKTMLRTKLVELDSVKNIMNVTEEVQTLDQGSLGLLT